MTGSIEATDRDLFAQVMDYANRANPYPLYARLRETPVVHADDGLGPLPDGVQLAGLVRRHAAVVAPHDARARAARRTPRRRSRAPRRHRPSGAARHPRTLGTDRCLRTRTRRDLTITVSPEAPNRPIWMMRRNPSAMERSPQSSARFHPIGRMPSRVLVPTSSWTKRQAGNARRSVHQVVGEKHTRVREDVRRTSKANASSRHGAVSVGARNRPPPFLALEYQGKPRFQ
jgi:hypothetical protein